MKPKTRGPAMALTMLVVATTTAPAWAVPYDLAFPRVDPSWGGRPGMPTAPTTISYVEAGLPAKLVGKERAAEYVRRLLASAATLDEATGFHLYAPLSGVTSIMGLPTVGIATAVQADAIAARARSAEPGLLAELDARFAALGAAVRRADAIVLAPPDPVAPQPVLYCRFIYNAANLPRPGLGEHLWKRCIQDRDAFLDILVGRMADLAVIPDLPTAPDPARQPPTQWEIPADLVLSPSVMPGEVRAPLPAARLTGPFDERLRERFEAALPRLQASLRAALARAALSNTYLPPAVTCAGVLGPYAGPLSRLQASAGVAERLRRTCMASAAEQAPAVVGRIGGEVEASLRDEETRAGIGDPGAAKLDFTPASKCAALVGPHFPPVRGPADRDAPSGKVTEECLAGAADIEATIMDRHLQAAIAASHPDPDTLQGWESRGWFFQPPGGTDWIDRWKNPTGTGRYLEAYEAAMAPRRKEAASRFAADIRRDFAVETGIEPQAAAEACAHRDQPTMDDLLSGGPAGETRPDPPPDEAFMAKPGLTAQEADGWIAMTCRDLHARTSARRRSLARAAGHAADLFPNGLKLAVKSPSGDPVPVDPAKLVDAAATDMLQVTFSPGGIASEPRMTVTPFGRPSPSMSGRLVGTTRPDGQSFLEVKGLHGFPDLDGQLATVACIAMQVGQAHREGRLRILGAATAAFFGDSFILAGSMEDEARQDLIDVEACASAKRAFLLGEASR